MSMSLRAIVGFVVLVVVGIVALNDPVYAVDCQQVPCDKVFPGADRFEPTTKNPAIFEAFRGEEKLGYIFKSTDIVDVKGYSGKPLITWVGLDLDGKVTGARVVEHAEPILLVGIPKESLDTFADQRDR